MTSISSNSPNPFARVQDMVQRDVTAGSVSSTDATAITAALGDIASTLSGGASTTTTTAATGSTAPTSMKDRVNGAIDNEVSSGKLTTSQGDELKTAFDQVHAQMHGAHGHHHGGGGGGGGMLDSLLASLTGQSSTDATSSTGTAAAGTVGATSTTATTNPLDTAATSAVAAIENFLAQFKATLGSNGVYNANGSSDSSATSLFVNSIG